MNLPEVPSHVNNAGSAPLKRARALLLFTLKWKETLLILICARHQFKYQ
jgi:hypothetical protein